MAMTLQEAAAAKKQKIADYTAQRDQQINDFKSAHGLSTESAPAAAEPAKAEETAPKKTPSIEEAFKTHEAESQAGINKIYDDNLNAQKQGLLDAYNQNVQTQAQQKEGIQQAFAPLNYDIGVQNDRNGENVTQFADVRDINTGYGSQHRLHLNNSRNAANAKLAYAQQQAMQESERQAALLETNYKNQVAAALADNDYKRAAALMDDYNNQNKWREAQAQQLASFGDFSAYKGLYGDDTANAMQSMWNAQNPEIAYRLGRISPETYRGITGHYPRGYSGGGGGGEGWYDPSGKPNPGGSGPLNQMQVMANFSNGVSNAGASVMSLAASGQSVPGGYDQYHT